LLMCVTKKHILEFVSYGCGLIQHTSTLNLPENVRNAAPSKKISLT